MIHIHCSMGSAPVGAQCPLTSSLSEFLGYRDWLWYPGLSLVLVSIALPFTFHISVFSIHSSSPAIGFPSSIFYDGVSAPHHQPSSLVMHNTSDKFSGPAGCNVILFMHCFTIHHSCLTVWILIPAYGLCFGQAPVDKLVPMTSLLWQSKTNRSLSLPGSCILERATTYM